MGGLENAVVQCHGVETSDGIDLGEENARLKTLLNKAADKLTQENSGMLSFFKKGPNGDVLTIAASDSISRKIDGVSQKGKFDACVAAGTEILNAIDAARNSKSAQRYIDSKSHQAPQVAGVRQSEAPQVAMGSADSYQKGIDMFKPGAQQSRLDAAMRAAGAD